ncbi:MAG: AAA family ATPase [bacterium]|nr:AAA family ATPase [bacterium]
MQLKRLELVGFKSFAQKTVLDFPAGITAIVGPNGSGKSNVIDAIRWLLGERDAKNIRGTKSEDLIFAGTPQKPRMGMAQATMIFENSDHFFPVDYDEVSITRKVSRGGDSEYFLNEASVRLKDIIDFFAKARLGTRGLTIVNQGNSDIFVRATPKERRAMIEEVLGLRQFQLKKHEAERKLVSTKFNLEKVKAMIDELTPHLRLLRRQAAKWEKQADVEKELHDLEAIYFGGRLFDIEKDLKDLEPQLNGLDKETNDKRRELKDVQGELAKVDKSGPKGDQNFQDFKKKQADFLFKKSIFQKDIGRLEAQMEFLVNQPKSEMKAAEAVKLLEETREKIGEALVEDDLVGLKSILRELSDKIERVLSVGSDNREGKVKELEKSKEKLFSDLAAVDAELGQLTGMEDKLAEDLRGFNAVFKKAFELVEAKKDEIQKLENEKNRLLFDRERITIRRQELHNLAAQAGRKLSDFSAKELVGGSPSSALVGGGGLAELEKKMFKLRAELAGIGDLDPALVKEAQDTEARHNFLSTQMADLDKASDDLGVLINDLDEKIHTEFDRAMSSINDEFDRYFKLMFGGGKASLKLVKDEPKPEVSDEVNMENATPGDEVPSEDEDAGHKVDHGGLEVHVSIPRKKISSLEMLSGGEKSLVSIAALFALISVSPPPFLVLDEIDAPLDERNARRFSDLIKTFSEKTQFLLVTHNRATMEAASVMYGVTMGDDGTSRVLSLKLE